MNETGRPPERPAANPITVADDSSACGGYRGVRLVRVFAGRRPTPRARTPRLDISIDFEGKISAAIRGSDNADEIARMRAWLEDDAELIELCRLVHRLRDRLGRA